MFLFRNLPATERLFAVIYTPLSTFIFFIPLDNWTMNITIKLAKCHNDNINSNGIKVSTSHLIVKGGKRL